MTRPPPATGSVWLRLSAVVALSAGIGAAVSAVLWDFRSDDTTAVAEAKPLIGVATPGAPNSKPAASPAPCPVGSGVSSSNAAESSSETPRVSLETLPLERDDRGGRASVSRSDASERRVQSRGRNRAESAKLASTAPAREEPKSKPAGPVNRAALAQAANQAASAATSCDTGPRRGRAAVTFAPSGNVMSVTLIQSFGDVAVNGCVLRAFGRVRIPPFSGDPVEVRKTVSW